LYHILRALPIMIPILFTINTSSDYLSMNIETGRAIVLASYIAISGFYVKKFYTSGNS
jgi:hypothetical protein